ncbi:MAG: hypothetical protein ACK4RS_01300 [Thiothrix sp.]
MQQWLQATLTDKLGENVPGGSHISQYARKYAIEEIARRELTERLLDWRIAKGG